MQRPADGGMKPDGHRHGYDVSCWFSSLLNISITYHWLTRTVLGVLSTEHTRCVDRLWRAGRGSRVVFQGPSPAVPGGCAGLLMLLRCRGLVRETEPATSWGQMLWERADTQEREAQRNAIEAEALNYSTTLT